MENSFIYGRGTRENRIDMGCRGLNAFAMRNYPDMPREVVAEDPVKKPIARADNAVLRLYADLASELGFVSPEITNLQQYPCSTAAVADYPRSSPPLVTPGPSVARAKRCGFPTTGPMKKTAGLYLSIIFMTGGKINARASLLSLCGDPCTLHSLVDQERCLKMVTAVAVRA
jgi:hypothetical protein